MFAVPDPSSVLKDIVGEMYFCNLQMLLYLISAVGYKAELSAEDKNGLYSLSYRSWRDPITD